MFHKVKEVRPLDNYVLSVQFGEGVVKEYDLKTLMSKVSFFDPLKEKDLFSEVKVDTGGYGKSWTDDIDLSSEELLPNQKDIEFYYEDELKVTDINISHSLSDATIQLYISNPQAYIIKDVEIKTPIRNQ